MYIKETEDGENYLVHCMYCENMQDPLIMQQIKNMCKSFNIRLDCVSTGICFNCYMKKMAELDEE